MIHLPNLITDLALILGAAALFTILFKWLKQPLVLGYLIAGFLVGPHFSLLPTVTETANISIWAEIGVIFLLFTLGLEFSFRKLLKVGAPASITALLEVVFMLTIGYLTGSMLGWSNMDSIFLGGVLSISSTTIIIRAFDELGLKGHQFASLVFGILIVEDLVAIVLMVLLSTLAVSTQFAGTEMLLSVAKLFFFLVLWFVTGIFVLPSLLRRAKKLMNDEMLLITSLALCMLMVWLATIVGFSPALGAFIMGSILAETVYAEKIEHLVKSVKDLFGAVFFVSVGMLFDPAMLVQYAWPVIIITLVTLAGKTLSTVAGALVSGQPLKTSVQAGFSLSQIGEFSFIIATLGMTLKVTSEFLYPIAVAVSAITTFTTPYMIRVSEPIYNWLNKTLPQSWIRAINRYSSKSQNKTELSLYQDYIRGALLNTGLLAVITTAIVLLSANYLLPYTVTTIGDNTMTTLIAAAGTLLAMSPFLWKLVAQPYRRDLAIELNSGNKYKGRLFFLYLTRIALAIFLIGFLLDRFFSPRIAFMVTTAMLIGLVLLSNKIQQLYSRIKEVFLHNYNERERKLSPIQAPWDAHLAEYEIAADWKDIGKTLLELEFRERFGVNVARITRGDKRINTPGRNEQIFPNDRILVIGTDEQLTAFRAELEQKIAPVKRNEIALEQMTLEPGNLLIGKSIRESGIREKTHGIVVDVESSGNRIINPDSNYQMQEGDLLWIVGDQLRIFSVMKASQAAG